MKTEKKSPISRRNQSKRADRTEKSSRNSDGLIRLNKFISDSGICSRRKADELISDGAVRVNGKLVSELGFKVAVTDRVYVNGNELSLNQRKIYILLNKPKDVITTTDDEFGRKTVLDIVRKQNRIFPVGRLDRNTTGALLITNDGELANRLMHPRYEVTKVYNATLDKKLLPDHAKILAEGVNIGGEKFSPCEILIDPANQAKISVILNEGKNKEVHRMFEFLGYLVKKLDRKYYAGLSTAGLKRGEYRHLSNSELLRLKKLVKL